MMATVVLKTKKQPSVFQINNGHMYCVDAKVNCELLLKRIRLSVFFITQAPDVKDISFYNIKITQCKKKSQYYYIIVKWNLF